MKVEPAIYLIPSPLNPEAPSILTLETYDIVDQLDYFAAERARTARRLIKVWFPEKDISSLEFVEWDKHAKIQPFHKWLEPVKKGRPMGVLSEAGCPGVADPGSGLVAEAHRLGIKVKPLIGPSSILLALMASGMNGQNFAFRGYLPQKGPELSSEIRKLESISARERSTQIFIETPYRNLSLMQNLLKYLSPSTQVCIAADLTGPDERIETRKVKDWGKQDLKWMIKVPAIFLLLA